MVPMHAEKRKGLSMNLAWERWRLAGVVRSRGPEVTSLNRYDAGNTLAAESLSFEIQVAMHQGA